MALGRRFMNLMGGGDVKSIETAIGAGPPFTPRGL
jgi:hypothetical protein